MMGSGIAYVTARGGMSCVLKDVSIAKAQQGKDYSARLLDKAIGRGKKTREEADEVLARIQATEDRHGLTGCDMIIEAVFEDRDLKAKVTSEAEAQARRGALLCSNTSTLPITGLAKAVRSQKDFIGLHFFSPVDKMPLVEIIVGEQTSDEALARAFDFVLAIKKTPIVVNDSRGFFTSRVFSTFVMEGIRMLSEGWNPSSIEQAALQNGSPVGPLAVCDEVSLELTRHVREQTKKDAEAEGKTLAPSPADVLVDRMCLELGRKGKAAGAGFYDYPSGGKKTLWQGLFEHFVLDERRRPTETEFCDLKDRLLYITALESIRCLEEGVVRSVGDANIGSIMGIGAPPWTGGTLQLVTHVGARRFVERALELAKDHGERFEPPKLLMDMAERNQTFE
jgi:3-hydroxyacyl-CoA dehydrogenase/enoyl-CoA hydratase/3-hydroxybutyryl-CoA epimerase